MSHLGSSCSCSGACSLGGMCGLGQLTAVLAVALLCPWPRLASVVYTRHSQITFKQNIYMGFLGDYTFIIPTLKKIMLACVCAPLQTTINFKQTTIMIYQTVLVEILYSHNNTTRVMLTSWRRAFTLQNKVYHHSSRVIYRSKC